MTYQYNDEIWWQQSDPLGWFSYERGKIIRRDILKGGNSFKAEDDYLGKVKWIEQDCNLYLLIEST